MYRAFLIKRKTKRRWQPLTPVSWLLIYSPGWMIVKFNMLLPLLTLLFVVSLSLPFLKQTNLQFQWLKSKALFSQFRSGRASSSGHAVLLQQ